MKKIFCGGSRQIGKLNIKIRNILNNIISKDYLILIGDANGADRAMQEYLAEKAYRCVIVFYAGNRCRNNVAKWKDQAVIINRPRMDFQYYAARDLKMCMEADYGFMLWDGKSKGTLNNIINLLQNNKVTTVYFSPQKVFLKIDSPGKLNELLQLCDKKLSDEMQKELELNKRVYSHQVEINFFEKNNT
jgi:hypothetical protein